MSSQAKAPTPLELKASLLKIAKDQRVRVAVLKPKYAPVALAFTRTILVPEPEELQDYFTALHEIGHVALKHKLEPLDPKLLVQKEIEAWEFGLSLAEFQPDQLSLKNMMSALYDYQAKPHYQDLPLKCRAFLDAHAKVRTWDYQYPYYDWEVRTFYQAMLRPRPPGWGKRPTLRYRLFSIVDLGVYKFSKLKRKVLKES